MSKSAMALSLVALGAAGWSVFAQQQQADDLAARRNAESELAARLTRLERAQAEGRRDAPGATFEGTAPVAGTEAASGEAAPPGAPQLTPAARPPGDVSARLAHLERQVAEVRAADVERSKQRSEGSGPTFSFGPPRGFWPTVDAAAKELDLDAAQRAGIERAVEDARRDLSELHTRANDEGLSLKQINETLAAATREGKDMETAFADHMGRMARWRRSKVPGSSETYAEAEARIRKQGKERARSYLNADQAKTWDKSHPDPMFGGDGAGMTSMVVVGAAPAIELALPDGDK